jgi:hypothetical protein
MKTIKEEEELISLGSKQMEQLRKEFLVPISRGKLGHARQVEALDRIFIVSQTNPKAFHRSWIEPLLAAGLSLEAALGHIIVSYFHPN